MGSLSESDGAYHLTAHAEQLNATSFPLQRMFACGSVER